MADPGRNRGQPPRVLWVEVNEDGTVGGSHQIMFDTVTRIDRNRFEPIPCFYQENPFAESYRELGYEVLVLDRLREDEVAIRAQGNRVVRTLDMLRAIARRSRLLRTHAIEILHLNNSHQKGFTDWLPAGKVSGIPVVANVMGDANPIEGGRIKRMLVAGFDHYLPISAYLEASLCRQGIPEKRTTLVRAGVDAAALRASVEASPAQVRLDLGLSRDQRVAVMVGNVRPWKGQHVVVEALGRVDALRRKKLVVAFVGAEDQRNEHYGSTLRARARELGVTDEIRWLGSRRDVPALFAAADVGLHASVIAEPFGLVMVECMAVGVPVIAAQEGGAAEIVTPETGWVYPGGDVEALAGLLEMVATWDPDDPVVTARRNACLLRSEAFGVEGMAEGVEEVWGRLLCRESSSGRG